MTKQSRGAPLTTSTALFDGETWRAEGEPSPVPWWSFTKTVLAAAVLRLADTGAIDLDAPYDTGLPYSVRHLLRHESGLPDYGGLPRYHEDVAAGRPAWPVADLLAASGADRLLFEPEAAFAYSNIGYLKVGERIEAASGLELAVALNQLVFAPAGAKTARLACDPADLEGVCMGDLQGYDPGWVYHGLVVGTVADAARVLHAVMSGGLIKPESLAAMRDARPLPQFRSETHPDPHYGLGLMMPEGAGADHPAGHTGEGPGSRMAVYSTGGRTAAVWTVLPAQASAEHLAREMLREG